MALFFKRLSSVPAQGIFWNYFTLESRILYVFEWDNRNKKYILKKNHLKISGDNKKPILQHIFEPVTKYSEISHNDDIKLVTKIKRIEDKLYSKKLFDGLE